MSVWAAAAVLGGLLGVLEYRRADRRHRWVRVPAVLVAVAALAALAAPPGIPAAGALLDTAVLLTPGATNVQREALRDSLPGAALVPWPDSVASIELLRLRMPGLRRLHVAGWGVRESAWEDHDDLEIVFHPSPPPPGFATITWPEVVRLGDDLSITARLAPGHTPEMVWLEHPDGRVDSIAGASRPDGVGRFRARPRAEGPGTWVLGASGVLPESLEVMVLPAAPPAVLVVEGAPSFETTFLRRWLAEQGATVAIRTRVARDQFRTERINAPEAVPGRLTPEVFRRFDLVLLDGATLAALGAGERAALDAAVREEGLGVLVRPDSMARRDAAWFPFRLAATGDLEGRLVRPDWPGQARRPALPVPALGEEIAATDLVTPLMRDPVGRIVAATVAHGAGVVGTSLVTAPSRWLLEEDPDAFAGYWRALFTALARARGEQWMLAADGPVVVDHGVSLVLVTADTLPLATVTGPDGTTDTLGLARDAAEPTRWWGRYWPRRPGWHRATNRDGESYPFHVTTMRLTAREAAARVAATARRAGAVTPGSPAPVPPGRRPLPPLLPFLALAGATGVLWGVERMGRTHRA